MIVMPAGLNTVALCHIASGRLNVKTIVQLAVFEFPAREVFRTLTDSDRFSAFSGNRAEIDAVAGGRFSTYGGHVTGTFREIVPNKLIVQEWRASDWPDDASSLVTIEFQEKRGATTLMLNQEGVPGEFAETVAQRWHNNCWDPLRDYLEDR